MGEEFDEIVKAAEENYEKQPKDENRGRALSLFLRASAIKPDDGFVNYRIGCCYEQGIGNAPDEQEALAWYEKAAAGGYEKACDRLRELYVERLGQAGNKKYYELLCQISENGSGPVNLPLARCYKEGVGVGKDAVKALQLFEKAAEQGNITALFELGLAYDDDGVGGLDHSKALSYYQQAYDAGYIRAAAALGQMYEQGRGVPVNTEKAYELYEQAAGQNDCAALTRLSSFHYYGKGTPVNFDKAIECLERAAEFGDEEAKAHMRRLLSDKEEIRKHPEEAFRYNRKLAEKGDAEAAFQVYLAYSRGIGVEKDQAAKRQWCERAAALGNPRAAAIAGRNLLETDTVKAVEYWELASKKGVSSAMVELASLYRNGRSPVAADKMRAYRWYEIAADMGDSEAQLELARMLRDGDGVPEDCARAERLYNMVIERIERKEMGTCKTARAELVRLYQEKLGEQDKAFAIWLEMAKEGDPDAQYNLGRCYYFGNGSAVDKEKAKQWWEQAASEGHEKAQRNLNALQQGQPIV